MKIAIVAPSPVPFTVGGAENLCWGLQQYINDATPHQCELIKLPLRERTFHDLMQGYLAFCRLDLAHFDVVVSTKYPSWMVRHPNHVCYMLHRLRGLYDTYRFTGLPETTGEPCAALAGIRAQMDAVARGPASAREVEALLERLLALDERALPAGALDFPGPFVREVVHRLDGIGLATSRVVRHVAISETVRQRKEYFPEGAKVAVAYPPPRVAHFTCGGAEYLFTASRLDGPKRIGLLVEAMRRASTRVPLYIAGTGPDEQRIKALADGDPRIHFLGFVNDDEMLEWYRNALAVPFVPLDEDYGLITIEAMLSGKPVLTVTDSGGPNEFVENGVTGWSVEPTAEAIAGAIDDLCADPARARALGRNARARVAGIGWGKVVDALLADAAAARGTPGKGRAVRPRLAVALTFPVYPPRGGGQSRVFHLYRQLARRADVELVTSCHPDEPAFQGEIAPGLTETRVPRSAAHQEAEAEYCRSVDWIPVTDIVMSELYTLTPEFGRELARACGRADILVASHPYLGRTLRAVDSRKPLWFEAHNVEFALKRAGLPDTEAGRALLEKVRRDEAFCWREAAFVFACADRDLATLGRLYGPTAARTLEVPNGVAIDEVPAVPLAERDVLRRRLGLGGRRLAVFMGSWHGPNLQAMERVLACAVASPEVVFLVLGSVCRAFADRSIPENVRLLGVVDDDEKAVVLGAVDVCLNPMESGSGSNLKMFDYFASGTPVVSTPFGARGIDVREGVHYLRAEVDGLPAALASALAMPESDRQALATRARRLVEDEYSWRTIADRLVGYLREHGEPCWSNGAPVAPGAGPSIVASSRA